MNDTGYHLAHETQASKVMYLDSRDGVGPGSSGSEFHAVFEDSMTTREDEGVLATGGVLSLASTTYKHYLVNQTKANIGSATHNIATQVKSLKGLIVRPQSNTSIYRGVHNTSQGRGREGRTTGRQKDADGCGVG